MCQGYCDLSCLNVCECICQCACFNVITGMWSSNEHEQIINPSFYVRLGVAIGLEAIYNLQSTPQLSQMYYGYLRWADGVTYFYGFHPKGNNLGIQQKTLVSKFVYLKKFLWFNVRKNNDYNEHDSIGYVCQKLIDTKTKTDTIPSPVLDSSSLVNNSEYLECQRGQLTRQVLACEMGIGCDLVNDSFCNLQANHIPRFTFYHCSPHNVSSLQAIIYPSLDYNHS